MKNNDSTETSATVVDNWNPSVVGKSQGRLVKYIAFQGQSIRSPQSDDELFVVLTGQLILASNDCFMVLNAGEFVLITKGIEYKTIALDKVHVMIYTTHPLTEDHCV